MSERLYTDLAHWWSLISPPEDSAEEAAVVVNLLLQGVEGSFGSLLELGSGCGHLASHMPEGMDVVLVDLSEPMLEVSRRVNARREHICGDMRSLRLDRQFDAVLIHDAIMYMQSPAELRQALTTAFVHLRPGGVALFLPDETEESYCEGTDTGGADGPDGSGVRYLEWHYDPDPGDFKTQMVFSFLVRDADGGVRTVLDEHTTGLFPRAMWWRALEAIGFEAVDPSVSKDSGFLEVFLVRRPR